MKRVTKEQIQWILVWRRLKATYRIIPKTPEGEGLRENLAQFFDECWWEDKIPRKYRK